MVERSGRWRVALLDALRDGLFVLDAGGSVVEINHAFTEILGFTQDGLPYPKPYPWWPDPVSDRAAYAEVLAASEEFEAGGVARWEIPFRHRDGHRVWVEISTDPVDDAHDPDIAVVGLIRDVTAEHRARAREQVLFDLSRLLNEPIALDDRLAGFVRSLAEAAGDLVVIARTEPDGRLRVTEAAHPHRPDLVDWVLGLGSGWVPAAVDARLRTGVAFVTGHVPDLLSSGFDDDASRAAISTMFAGGAAPIAVGDRLLGALALVRTAPTRAFDQADQALGEELGRRLGGVIEADRIASGERQLHQATSALAAAITVAQAAEVLADAVGRAMGAASTSVYVPDPDNPARLTLLHSAGYSEEMAAGWSSIQLRDSLPVADVVHTGSPIWLHSWQVWRARYPDLAVAAAAEGLVAFAALPLRLGDRVLGVLGVGFGTARLFPESERDFVSTLVTHAAQAFERAALTDARWRIAQTMQRALLPTELPTLPGLTLAAHYQPAGLHSQAGGDWYDVIALDTDRVAIVMGDVVGAGASAAAIMGQLRGRWPRCCSTANPAPTRCAGSAASPPASRAPPSARRSSSYSTPSPVS